MRNQNITNPSILAKQGHIVNSINTRTPRRLQRGQSIFELVIYAVVAGLIVAGAAYLFFTIRAGIEVKNATSDLGVMVSKAQSLYSNSQDGFSTATASSLIDNGVVPARMVQGGVIASSLAGAVTVTPVSLYGGGSNGLKFNFAALPSADCSDFVRGVAGWFVQINVAGQSVKDMTTGKDLDTAALGNACSGSQSVSTDFIAGR